MHIYQHSSVPTTYDSLFKCQFASGVIWVMSTGSRRAVTLHANGACVQNHNPNVQDITFITSHCFSLRRHHLCRCHNLTHARTHTWTCATAGRLCWWRTLQQVVEMEGEPTQRSFLQKFFGKLTSTRKYWPQNKQHIQNWHTKQTNKSVQMHAWCKHVCMCVCVCVSQCMGVN